MVISLELLQVHDIHHCKFLMISSTQSGDRKFFGLIFQYTFTGSVHESAGQLSPLAMVLVQGGEYIFGIGKKMG